MKIFTINSITIFVSLMVLFNLCNTPTVETGPAATATCILACCGTACASASTVCLPLGAATGIFGLLAATGCFMAAGGGCAACVSLCVPTLSLPTPQIPKLKEQSNLKMNAIQFSLLVCPRLRHILCTIPCKVVSLSLGHWILCCACLIPGTQIWILKLASCILHYQIWVFWISKPSSLRINSQILKSGHLTWDECIVSYLENELINLSTLEL